MKHASDGYADDAEATTAMQTSKAPAECLVAWSSRERVCATRGRGVGENWGSMRSPRRVRNGNSAATSRVKLFTGVMKESPVKGWQNHSMVDMDLGTAVLRRGVHCAIEKLKNRTAERSGTEKHRC